MATILALARAEFQDVVRLHRWRLAAHCGTLAAGIAALFAREPAAYVLSVAAVLCEIAAWAVRVYARRKQGHASDAMRRALLADAFGQSSEPLETADLRQGFSRRTEKAASKYEDPRYFASTQAAGPNRLLEHLQESAFWSKHLFRVAANRSRMVWILVLAAVGLVAAFAQPFFSSNAVLIFARTAALFLSFVSVTDGLNRAFEWKEAADRSDAIDRRLEHLKPEEHQALLAAFADYATSTSSAAPIPPSIYSSEKERLTERWRERKGLPGPTQEPAKA